MGVFNYVKADEGDKCPHCNAKIEEWQTKDMISGALPWQNTVSKDEVPYYYTFCDNCKKEVDYTRRIFYSKEFYLVGSGADISSKIIDTDDCININYSDDTVDINRLYRDLKEKLYGCQIHITKDHPVELENNSWVSVDDELPKSHNDCLVAYIPKRKEEMFEDDLIDESEQYEYCTAFFDCEEQKWYPKDQLMYSKRKVIVTHWQPLPQPPKTEEI